MKSKMLGALALFTLIGAMFVMQSANDQYTPTVDAATGSIAALNVGTCLTTDDSVFGEESCSLSGDGSGDDAVKWEVRKDVAEVSDLYATYAHDPKTSSDEPRAILMDSDLIKISIADTGRDKRSGVLVRGASNTEAIATAVTATSLRAVIKEDLDKDGLDYGSPLHDNDTDAQTDDVIQFTSEDASADDGISMATSDTLGATEASIITSSGNHTLNFFREALDGDNTNGTAWQFDPGDFDVENGAIVRFYGCVSLGTTLCADDNADADDTTPVTDPIMRLKELVVDEDRSNGEASGDTPPWLSVNASVPSGTQIIILAVYYRTSVEENLVGGHTYRYCEDDGHKVVDRGGDVGLKCDDPDSETDADVMMRDGEMDVVYTSKEMDGNDALVVRATSDGDKRSANLYLSEESAFSGRYEGHLRLTDADGQGPDADSNTMGSQRSNWGLDVKNGMTDNTKENAAVLGVESGPVTIEYRDSDGKMQRFRIEIDNRPPSINVEAPAHGSASDDQSPDFKGKIEDPDSGLAADSFRLVVDNAIDGEGKNADFVLTGKAPTAESVMAATGKSKVTHIGEYAGYDDTASTIGITSAMALYDLGDDSCSDQDQCHILAESYDDGANSGTFEDTLRLDLRDGDDDAEIRDMEYEIDFQAFVMDMAGNIGFSDSDPANPRFINDLGEADKDKRKAGNVLGYYSAHVITLDEKDPVILAGQSVTGMYGKGNVDRSGIKVVFDGPIAASSVSTSTFTVEGAKVVDVDVDGSNVYLKLDSELASDAMPEVDIANGEMVEDMAGNETFGREVDAFKVADGISPRLTVTLSGGSGSGDGKEGPANLTKDKITVHVSSDEDLQSAPRIVVTCSSLSWKKGDAKKDIDDFIANRNVASEGKPEDMPDMTPAKLTGNNRNEMYDYTCGYENDDGVVQDFNLTEVASLSRQGNNWEYTWQKDGLRDGKLTAVAFGRDRSRYAGAAGKMLENWGAASAEFTLDTELKSPTENSGGELQPGPGGESKDERPFVLIEFNEGTTVTLDSVELDGVEIADEFEQPDMNRFLYWPLSISQGKHEIEVEASDAAKNEVSFDYSFTVEARGDFVIELNAGWNAISVPADPKDTAIGSVFSASVISTVIGWDTQGWRIAMRRDGLWESNEKYGALNEIRAKYGYWVKSDGFVKQRVALKGGTSRDAGGTPLLISIPTEPGWNFVGVVDQDGEQTEDDFGNSLMDSDNTPIDASEYLGSNYVRAYTWDATFSRFEVVRPDHDMMIGDGVWVYYPEGSTGIAP